MFSAIRTIVRVLWAIVALLGGVGLGTFYGWQSYGIGGAVGGGVLGLILGALAAAAPAIFFDLLSAWL